MSLTKNEVVTMAQEADDTIRSKPFTAEMLSFLERFATLCRAPLVAENAALKQAHEINADTLNAMQVEIDDWKARALKSEQAVAEWQGSADGGKSWRRIDKPRGESIESRVAHLRNMTNSQGRPIYLIRALYTTPKPAAQESPSAVPVAEQLVEALEQSKNWHQGDKWRDDSKNRPVWESHMDTLNGAITKGQKFIKENGK